MKCFSLTQSEGSGLLYREHAPSTLTGKVNQLEVILRQLQTDLRKARDHQRYYFFPVLIVVFLCRVHSGLEKSTSVKLASVINEWQSPGVDQNTKVPKVLWEWLCEQAANQFMGLYSRVTVLHIVIPQKELVTLSPFMVSWV